MLGDRQPDASLGLSDLRLKWLPDFSLTVKDVSDTRAYSIREILETGPYKDQQYEYVTPRAIFLRLSGHF